MKRILSFFISLTLTFVASEIFAYHPPTHSLITNKALSGSQNYQEFKKTIGKDGDKKLIEGTVQEDYPVRRAIHHFFDPVNNKGLHNSFLNLGEISKEWGFNGNSNLLAYPYLNEYSWTKAREYEYIALTGKDFVGNIVAGNQSARDQQFEKMFRSVGQVMHLVQDLAQPSHTRNDAHISAGGIGDISYLEYWAEGNAGLIENFASASVAPKTANSYDAFFDQLAGYSNTNFFSDDTIFKDYALPDESQTSFGVQTVTAEDGKLEKVVYLTKITGENAGCKLAQAGYFSIELTVLQIFASPLKYHIGDEVAKENASFLIPKAVEYSAGILDYFFRGVMEVQEVYSGAITVTNASPEAMNGVFVLFYDSNTGIGERKEVPGASWNLSLQPGETSALLNFTGPTDAGPKDIPYILVFRGQLGSELDAVAGKPWIGNREKIVFVKTVTAADPIFFGPYGSNYSYLVSVEKVGRREELSC